MGISQPIPSQWKKSVTIAQKYAFQISYEGKGNIPAQEIIGHIQAVSLENKQETELQNPSIRRIQGKNSNPKSQSVLCYNTFRSIFYLPPFLA